MWKLSREPWHDWSISPSVWGGGAPIVILTPPYQAELVPLAAGSLWGENACVPLCMCGTSRGLNPTWSMLTLVCILFILSSPHLK